MNKLQLIARTRFFIDEPVQQNWLDTDILIALNRAQEDVAKEIVQVKEDYFVKVSDLNPSGTPPGTIAGQELYNLPPDFFEFKRIERSDTGEALAPVDLNEKDSSNSSLSPASLNNKMGYYVIGSSIGFSPVPQGSIPIRLWYVPILLDMVNDADVSLIPSNYHDMMAIRAAIDAFMKDEADTSALERRWDRQVAQLQRTIRNRQIQEPKHVQRVDDSGNNYYGALL